MDHKVSQEKTVTIHWHNKLLEIPKWIIEWHSEENIDLDDKYLDELYSYRRPPMFSFQADQNNDSIFSFSLSITLQVKGGATAPPSFFRF